MTRGRDSVHVPLGDHGSGCGAAGECQLGVNGKFLNLGYFGLKQQQKVQDVNNSYKTQEKIETLSVLDTGQSLNEDFRPTNYIVFP